MFSFPSLISAGRVCPEFRVAGYRSLFNYELVIPRNAGCASALYPSKAGQRATRNLQPQILLQPHSYIENSKHPRYRQQSYRVEVDFFDCRIIGQKSREPTQCFRDCFPI